MTIWIALLRGVNVGGNNSLPMKQWASGLESLGATDVRTYIQSGNAVFRHSAKSKLTLAKQIASQIEAEHGFAPGVFLLTAGELQDAIDAFPFQVDDWRTNTFHFFFLGKKAKKADLPAIEKAKAATETYHLTDTVFYLSAPDGIGRSKLAASVERHLGVDVTARNGRTVGKLCELMDE